MKPIFGMIKLNLTQAKSAYLSTAIVVALGVASYITNALIALNLAIGADSSTTSPGNYLYILPLLLAAIVPARHFTKLAHLGGKRTDFFFACVLSYLPVVAVASLGSILAHALFDRLVLRHLIGIIDLLDVFGFMARGPVMAFFQMSAFLFLCCCFIHTIVLIQGRWYGWVIDALLIAIISVFTPIAPLRAALVWFFNQIIFHHQAAVQIASCLVLGAAIYCLSLIPIRSKQI